MTKGPKLELELASAFEQYIKKIQINKRYHNALSEIEQKINKHTITLEYLNQIFIILKNPI
jgi:hypothetical protein